MLVKDRHERRLAMMFDVACRLKPVARARIAAGLWIKNDLVSIGFNQMKSSPFAASFGKNEHAIFFHAESHAIKRAISMLGEEKIRTSKTCLYIARAKLVKGKFVAAMSKPCNGCMDLIKEFKIDRVLYTIEDDHYGIMKS